MKMPDSDSGPGPKDDGPRGRRRAGATKRERSPKQYETHNSPFSAQRTSPWRSALASQTWRGIGALLRRGEEERWLLSAFRLETVDRCRALVPTIRTAWLVGHVPDDVVATMVGRGHSALHPWVGALNRSHIDVCHGAGIAVNTWTCDDPRRMAELIEWGIDGICTNVPDVAIGVIAAAQTPPLRTLGLGDG